MPHDFNSAILDDVAHRPWSMPDRPWVMTQTWNDLLFAHWTIDPAALRPKVPAAFDLDLYDGTAWIAIVPFFMTNVAPRGVPALPRISEFAELNVRTYVRVADRPGIYFFSLDAASALAVKTARALFNLPYYTASMTVSATADGVDYRSEREAPAASLRAAYHPIGAPFHPIEGTLEYFLTERYCLFTVDDAFHAYSLDIHHPRWPLQTAEAEITVNTMAEAAGIRLPSMAPRLHFSKRQDMVAWPLRSEPL